MRLAVLLMVLGILALGFIPMMLAIPQPDWPAWMIAVGYLAPIFLSVVFLMAARVIYRREKRLTTDESGK